MNLVASTGGHRFGSGVLSRCSECGLRRARRGATLSYASPGSDAWFDASEPPECPGPETEAPSGIDLSEGDWRSRTLIAFDLETTGLRWAESLITEVGASVGKLQADGSVLIVNQYTSLCYVPESHRQQAEETCKVTGITYEELRRAPQIGFVLNQLERFFDSCPQNALLVSFNSFFDGPFLQSAYLRAGMAPHRFLLREQILDPMLWSRRVDKYVKGGHKLMTVATRKGVLREEDTSRAHRADFDAEVALRVLGVFAKDVPSQLDELLLWQRASRGAWEENFFNYKLKELRASRVVDNE